MSDSSKKSNKIRDIVRLQQMLKKWKKLANNKNDDNNNNNNYDPPTPTLTPTTTASKGIKFLKKTLSFSELTLANNSSSSSSAVPKGYVAVCVGEEMKRFVIPTEYLRRQVFGVLLREAEEEFGFQQEGILRFPCEVGLFEKILKTMEDSKQRSSSSASLVELHDREVERLDVHDLIMNTSAYDQLSSQHHPQMCRSR